MLEAVRSCRPQSAIGAVVLVCPAPFGGVRVAAAFGSRVVLSPILRVMVRSVDNGVYDRLGGSWWDQTSPLNVLHGSITPGRFAYFRSVLDRQFGAGAGGVRVLDIGCGGGFLAEEFAALGCRVTGVDPSGASVGAARAHAAGRGLRIDYRVGVGEDLPVPDAAFSVACCCDVLEHVSDVDRVISETARVLEPGGLFLFDTLNRTRTSKLLAIKAVQQWPLTRLTDIAFHDWDMFITPRSWPPSWNATGSPPARRPSWTARPPENPGPYSLLAKCWKSAGTGVQGGCGATCRRSGRTVARQMTCSPAARGRLRRSAGRPARSPRPGRPRVRGGAVPRTWITCGRGRAPGCGRARGQPPPGDRRRPPRPSQGSVAGQPARYRCAQTSRSTSRIAVISAASSVSGG